MYIYIYIEIYRNLEINASGLEKKPKMIAFGGTTVDVARFLGWHTIVFTLGGINLIGPIIEMRNMCFCIKIYSGIVFSSV